MASASAGRRSNRSGLPARSRGGARQDRRLAGGGLDRLRELGRVGGGEHHDRRRSSRRRAGAPATPTAVCGSISSPVSRRVETMVAGGLALADRRRRRRARASAARAWGGMSMHAGLGEGREGARRSRGRRGARTRNRAARSWRPTGCPWPATGSAATDAPGVAAVLEGAGQDVVGVGGDDDPRDRQAHAAWRHSRRRRRRSCPTAPRRPPRGAARPAPRRR